MFCKYCGSCIPDDSRNCEHCGRSLIDTYQQNEFPNQNYQQQEFQQPQQQQTADTGAAGYGVLGFFVPLAGIILYLVWKQTFPKRAKAGLKGALIGIGLSIIFYIIYISIFLSAMSVF